MEHKSASFNNGLINTLAPLIGSSRSSALYQITQRACFARLLLMIVFLSELNERPAAITVSNRKQPELMSAVYSAADMPAPVALAALCHNRTHAPQQNPITR